MTDLLTLALSTGYPVVAVPGWESRGRGGLDPQGVLWHHTASNRAGGNAPCERLVVNGRADLPGPLCNFLIGRDGTIFVVAAGVANHAGQVSAPDYLAVAAGVMPIDEQNIPSNRSDLVPNRHLYGIEVENDGRDEPYSDKALDALVALSAALCRHHGWGAGSCCHHRELTRRKIDMSFHGPLRRAVAARLSAPPLGSSVTMTPTPKEIKMPVLFQETGSPTIWLVMPDGVTPAAQLRNWSQVVAEASALPGIFEVAPGYIAELNQARAEARTH